MEDLETVIQTKDISKELNGALAVQNATFYVPKGSIFGFIGPSGSGKTTTIRLLTGYYRPTSGEVRVFGVSPDGFSVKERERIGYLPQLFSLYPDLTVWENLNFAASIYGLPFIRRKQLLEILDFVELTQERGKMARYLSGGMQRRLNLAATLVHNPDLIFLDEPTAGVDPILRRKFWDHFRALQAQGCTMFVTTQYVSEAEYCDLVGVIHLGRLITVDRPAQLRYRAFGGDLVDLRTAAPLNYESLMAINALPFVRVKAQLKDEHRLRLVVNKASTDIATLVGWARERDLQIEEIMEYLPPFDDVFVELVKTEAEDD